MVVLWQILRRRLQGLNTYLTVRTLVRLTVAGIPAGLLGWATLHLVQRVVPAGRLGALLVILAVAAVGGVVFVVVARRLRVAEVNEIVDVVTARLGRSRG
jgi:putative peptidoglycan lipid II flippase